MSSAIRLPLEMLLRIAELGALASGKWGTYRVLLLLLKQGHRTPAPVILQKFAPTRCSYEELQHFYLKYKGNEQMQSLFAAANVHYHNVAGETSMFVKHRNFYAALERLGFTACRNRSPPHLFNPAYSRQFVDFEAVATTPLGIRTARRLLALLSDNGPGSLHREKCRRVSIFMETEILCPQFGLFGKLQKVYKAEVGEVSELFQKLRGALALFNGYDEENWTTIPNQPPFLDSFVVFKVFPVLLEALQVPAFENFCEWKEYNVERHWGQFRERCGSVLKEEVDRVVELMGTLRELAVCFSDWPNMDACPGCCPPVKSQTKWE